MRAQAVAGAFLLGATLLTIAIVMRALPDIEELALLVVIRAIPYLEYWLCVHLAAKNFSGRALGAALGGGIGLVLADAFVSYQVFFDPKAGSTQGVLLMVGLLAESLLIVPLGLLAGSTVFQTRRGRPPWVRW